MFTYEVKQNDGITEVAFQGDMDIDVTEIIEGEITSRLLDCLAVEIDFSQVSFVDSSGIGLLISLVHCLKERNVQITIVKVKDDVKQVFQLLQLLEILGPDVFVDF